MKTFTFSQRMEVTVTFQIQADDDFDPTDFNQVDCSVTVDAFPADDYEVDLQLVESVVVTGFEIADEVTA